MGKTTGTSPAFSEKALEEMVHAVEECSDRFHVLPMDNISLAGDHGSESGS
jgi:hypothetical protein